MGELEASTFTLPGNPRDGGLAIVLTRYRPKISSKADATRRLSLVFKHAISSHKEAWLPTISHLFSLQAASPINNCIILEAWSMDSPNHGHAAVINEHLLVDHPDGMTAHTCGRYVRTFIDSGLIDQSGNGVVGIGHSAGACILTLSAFDPLPYASLILVDPPMMTQEILTRAMERHAPLLGAIELAKQRKDIWPSRKVAKEWLAKRFPWRRWTQESLQLYVDHALRDLPTVTYPNHKEGVTLSCTRVQESAGYVYHQDGIDSLVRLSELCPVIPVHCIFGEKPDMVQEETQQAIIDERSGRYMTSIARVKGAGHLVVQEQPEGLALAIWSALQYEHSARPRSKL